MKKTIRAIGLVSLLAGALNGGDIETMKARMMRQDMRTMLESMEQIQRGGFYSSADDMKAGVKKLQGTLKTLEGDEIKWILPKIKCMRINLPKNRHRCCVFILMI